MIVTANRIEAGEGGYVGDGVLFGLVRPSGSGGTSVPFVSPGGKVGLAP